MNKLLWLVVVLVSCASAEDAVFDSTGLADASVEDGAGGDAATCNLNSCPTPPYAGMQKCCASSKACGFKTAEGGTCYGVDSGTGGKGGSGGF